MKILSVNKKSFNKQYSSLTIELLQKALEMTQLCYGEEDINCASIMTLLANCYTKTQDYDQALEYISKVMK